ncbi:hypothetical protein ACG83_16290 [Frankia sp. R43]|nr:hypothetical protein ACG83_16290 [Frankia sp. R43]
MANRNRGTDRLVQRTRRRTPDGVNFGTTYLPAAGPAANFRHVPALAQAPQSLGRGSFDISSSDLGCVASPSRIP